MLHITSAQVLRTLCAIGICTFCITGIMSNAEAAKRLSSTADGNVFTGNYPIRGETRAVAAWHDYEGMLIRWYTQPGGENPQGNPTFPSIEGAEEVVITPHHFGMGRTILRPGADGKMHDVLLPSILMLREEGTITTTGLITGNGFDASNANLVNLAKGTISDTSTDGINGSQLHEVARHMGFDIHHDGDTLNLEIRPDAPIVSKDDFAGLTHEVTQLTHTVGDLGQQVRSVGAHAAAHAALKPLPYSAARPVNLSASYGRYAGQGAAALGIFYTPNPDFSMHVGASWDNSDEMMLSGGVSVRVGGKRDMPFYREGHFEEQNQFLMVQNQQLLETLDRAMTRIEHLEKRLEELERNIPSRA